MKTGFQNSWRFCCKSWEKYQASLVSISGLKLHSSLLIISSHFLPNSWISLQSPRFFLGLERIFPKAILLECYCYGFCGIFSSAYWYYFRLIAPKMLPLYYQVLEPSGALFNATSTFACRISSPGLSSSTTTVISIIVVKYFMDVFYLSFPWLFSGTSAKNLVQYSALLTVTPYF